MKKLIQLLLFAFCASIFLHSCGDDPIGGKEETKPCSLYGECVFKLPSYVNDTNLVGHIYVVNQRNMLITPFIVDSNLECYSKAGFCRYEPGMADYYGLLINEDTMSYNCIGADCLGCPVSSCWYEFHNDNFAFNGQKFTWNFSGTNFIRPFKIFMEAPKSIYYIVSPQTGTIISKSRPLLIEWNGEHQPGLNQVQIKLHNPVLGIKSDVIYYTDDTGSYTIPAEALKPFPNLFIILRVGRSAVYQNSPGKYIVAEAYSEYTASFKVMD